MTINQELDYDNVSELEIVTIEPVSAFNSLFDECVKQIDEVSTNKALEKSKQIKDEFCGLMHDIIEPFYDMSHLITMATKNTRLMRLIKVKSRNIAGLGYNIVSKKTKDQLKLAEERGEINLEKELIKIEEEKKIAEEFFDNCNDELPITSILYRTRISREQCGNAFLEITRDLEGNLASLYFVNPSTIRIRVDPETGEQIGFIQKKNGKIRYFKKFGDTDIWDAVNGKNISEEKREKEKSRQPNEDLIDDADNYPFFNDNTKDQYREEDLDQGEFDIGFDRRASEMIHFAEFSLEDDFYGVPVWVSSVKAVLGNWNASTRNLAFFENDGTPRNLIVISGGRVSDSTKTELQEFINSKGKNPRNAHRSCIIQLKKIYDAGSVPEVKFIPITVGKDEDYTHSKYIYNNNEEIRESFGFAKVFLGTSDDVNRATALITRQVTNQQEIEPEAKEDEFVINKKLIEKGLGLTRVKFQLKRPDVSDDLDTALTYGNLSNIGAVTPNEIRQEFGYEEYPESESWANVPFPITLKSIVSGNRTSGKTNVSSGTNTGEREQDIENDSVDEKPEGRSTNSLSDQIFINKVDAELQRRQEKKIYKEFF